MSNPTAEIADKPLEFHQSADFDLLLNQARLHLRDLAGKVWTDHNAHDPGMTILETLCFAIADLSYRTSFDVKDLMAGYTGGLDLPEDLPLADIALPNHPLTIRDLRKVLLDLKDPNAPKRLLLRNAWPMIVTETEAPLFLLGGESVPGWLSLEREKEIVGGPTTTNPVSNTAATPPKGLTPKTTQPAEPIKSLAASTPKTPVKSVGGEKVISKGLQQTQKHQEVEALQARKVIASQDAKVTTKAIASNQKNQEGIAITKTQLATSGAYASAQVASFQTAVTSVNALSSTPVAVGNTNVLTPNPNNPSTIFTPPGGGLAWEFPEDALRLNGLYGIQLEFEEDRSQSEYYLSDLNKNYFRPKVTVQGKGLTLNILMPYWDQIQWSFKDLDLNTVTPAFTVRNQQGDPYYIGVDKLNYDDYFYDYYAEVQLGSYVLPAFVNLATPLRSEIQFAGQSLPFEAKWLDWNELANGVKMNYGNVSTQVEGIDFVGIDDQDLVYDIRLTFDNQLPAPNNRQYPILLRIVFDAGLVLPNYFYVSTALRAKLPNLFQQRIDLETAVKQELLDAQGDLYTHYQSKVNRVFKLVYGKEGVWEHLGKHRNLCEDFQSFSASRVQEIALFGKLLVQPGYNVNQVLGELYFQIDQFLHPLIQFHSLSEISEKGYRMEDIFKGPLLDHGFIEDSDLANLDRRSVIYTSDLVRILMDVDGVEAIEDFSISSYIDNRLMGRKVTNCLSLTYADVYRPRLSVEKSGLAVEVGKVLETPETKKVLEWYHHKLDELKAGQLPEGLASQLELPIGQSRNTEVYRSIQYDFPQIYGIGPFGLPAEATDDRKARAQQLKAYLLPFEQMLANYLKQISHLPALFSFNDTIETTYPHTPLYDVPEVAPLFRSFLQSGTTWELFKADPDNAYRTTLQENEDESTWHHRRNRFLDHLLGRFSESFTDYAVQLFNQHKHLLDQPSLSQMKLYEKERQAEMKRLVGDKVAFGMDLPAVTNRRNQGFNYQITDEANQGWGSGNVSGYKRRLCRLLGIRDVSHHFIFDQVDPENKNQKIDLEGMHVIEHILLRPKVNYVTFTPVPNLPLQNQNDGSGYYLYDADRDPYSFRVTVILPMGAGRFVNPQFRKFAERLIRQETPAHILPEIRWMSGACGHDLETAYKGWIENSYKLKPWEFQQWHQNPALAKANLSIDSAAFLGGRNWLVFAMQAPCKVSLKALNPAQQVLSPINGLVKLPYGSDDVHAFQLSHLGGTLRVLALKSPENKWEERYTSGPLGANWLPVKDLVGKDQGLIEALGGEGKYLIEYQVGSEKVEFNLFATAPNLKPGILLINNLKSSLTDSGDTIEIQVANLRDTRLGVQPPFGEFSFATEPGVWRPVPYRSNANNEWRLSDFERDFKNGTYQFRYAVNGEATDVTIKIIQGIVVQEDTILRLKANDVPALSSPVEIDPFLPGIVWSFDFIPIGGDVSFYKIENGQPNLFATEAVTLQNHQQPLEVGDVWAEKGNGLYRATYNTTSGTDSVEFKLEGSPSLRWSYANDWVFVHFPSGTEVAPDGKVYRLKLDPKGPKQPYAFRFKSTKGKLSIFQKEKLIIEFTGNEMLIGAGDLPPGIYQASYDRGNGQEEVKILEVAGEKEPFLIEKVTQLKENSFRMEPLTEVEGEEKLVWRVNGRYRSKSRAPRLTLTFSNPEDVAVSLTIVKGGEEETFEMKFSLEMLKNWGDGN